VRAGNIGEDDYGALVRMVRKRKDDYKIFLKIIVEDSLEWLSVRTQNCLYTLL
jgi:hypothetical protein